MEIIKNRKIEFVKDDFLWKYLDLHKFLSFVLNKKLFFNRLDNLLDPLEGLPESTLNYLDKSEQEINVLGPENKNTEIKRKRISEKRNSAQVAVKSALESQQNQFANSWYVGKKESFAMWNIYSNPDSVAIRYVPHELLDMIIPSAKNLENRDFTRFIYGYVEYGDIWPFRPKKAGMPGGQFASFRKDSSYKHEQEFRFVAVLQQKHKGKYDYWELPLNEVATDSFLVFANPYMEAWKFNNLKKFLSIYGWEERIIQSALKVKK